jgi:hypothetical protein
MERVAGGVRPAIRQSEPTHRRQTALTLGRSKFGLFADRDRGIVVLLLVLFVEPHFRRGLQLADGNP